jgi:hypothetical protein
MSRSRNIKPGFFQNDTLAELDPLARILFAGLWCEADRSGRLLDRPKKIKAACLPYDDCDANALLDQLAARGFIMRYVVETVAIIQVCEFSKHQNPHKKEAESVLPPPEKMQAPCKHHASTVHGPEIPESARLIPDSLNLIPDSIESSDDDSCPPPNGEAPKRNDPIPYQAVADAYNATMAGLAKVRDMTGKRRTRLRTSWTGRRRSLAFWQAYFAECQRDNFLNGTGPYRNGHENWRPDFDYLIREDVVVRTYERAISRMEREHA